VLVTASLGLLHAYVSRCVHFLLACTLGLAIRVAKLLLIVTFVVVLVLMTAATVYVISR
jgi:hypothetical protein